MLEITTRSDKCGDHRCRFPIQPPELERSQAVSEGAFYRVPTVAGTGSAR